MASVQEGEGAGASAGVKQVTERDWVPPPQEAEQAPYCPATHRLAAQGSVLQVCEAVGCVAALHMLLLTVEFPIEDVQVIGRVWLPPPHEVLQGAQGPAFQEYTGQGSTLQACDEVMGCEALQNDSATTFPVWSWHVIRRVWVPEPQDIVHAVQLAAAQE